MRLLLIRRGKSVLKDADQRVSVIKFKGREKKVGEGVFVLEKSGGNGVGSGNSPLKRHLQKFESAYSNLGQFGSCMTATEKRLNNNFTKALKKDKSSNSWTYQRFFFVCLQLEPGFQKNGQAVPSCNHGSTRIGERNYIPEDCAKFWLGVFVQRPLSARQRSGKHR